MSLPKPTTTIASSQRPELDIGEMMATASLLQPYVLRTPVTVLHGTQVDPFIRRMASVHLKLELLQRTGTFKARGALNNVLALDQASLQLGVTTASSGNHGIATAFAARTAGTSAKIFMLATANRIRVAAARAFGAEVLSAPDGPTAFAFAEQAARVDGRAMIHPYESHRTSLGTSTIAIELVEQLPFVDAVVVAVGGGGLASGLAAGLKALKPQCLVFGVEPEGANVMQQSFHTGETTELPSSRSIADSLCAPMTLPYSLALCLAHMEGVVTVSDDEIRRALALLFFDAKLAVEPSAAAALAAAIGPLSDKLRDRHVALIVCGSNIDPESFSLHLSHGEALLERKVPATHSVGLVEESGQ